MINRPLLPTASRICSSTSYMGSFLTADRIDGMRPLDAHAGNPIPGAFIGATGNRLLGDLSDGALKQKDAKTSKGKVLHKLFTKSYWGITCEEHSLAFFPFASRFDLFIERTDQALRNEKSGEVPIWDKPG